MISLDEADTLGRTGPGATPVRVLGWSARSSQGRVRTRNEDSWGEAHGCVFAVADGMGGAAGGQRASTLAVAGLLAADATAGWTGALRLLNDAISRQCRAEGFPSAGSTLVAVVVDRGRCVTIHIGDSRIYRLRSGELCRLTSDHNLANLRRDEGLDPRADDGRGGPRALTSYLGNPMAGQRVDVGTVSAEPADRLLMCTDGIHGQMSEATIGQLLRHGDCQEAADLLVAEADRAGGRDNATALVVEIGPR